MYDKVDFAFLEKQYHFIIKQPQQLVLSACLSDLADEEKGKKLIQDVMRIIRAGEPDIAAFHMSSWFGMVCSAAQASLSLFDTVLLLSPDRLRLEIQLIEGRRKVSFRLIDPEQACMPAAADAGSRAEALNDFYTQTVRPFIRGLACASSTKENQLWPQFAARLHNDKDHLLKIALLPERQSRIEQDFTVLLKGLDLEKLGLRRNPFDLEFQRIEHLSNPDEQVRRKAACCLAYKTDTNHGYCYTCPRLNEEGRKMKREAAALSS